MDSIKNTVNDNTQMNYEGFIGEFVWKPINGGKYLPTIRLKKYVCKTENEDLFVCIDDKKDEFEQKVLDWVNQSTKSSRLKQVYSFDGKYIEVVAYSFGVSKSEIKYYSKTTVFIPFETMPSHNERGQLNLIPNKANVYLHKDFFDKCKNLFVNSFPDEQYDYVRSAVDREEKTIKIDDDQYVKVMEIDYDSVIDDLIDEAVNNYLDDHEGMDSDTVRKLKFYGGIFMREREIKVPPEGYKAIDDNKDIYIKRGENIPKNIRKYIIIGDDNLFEYNTDEKKLYVRDYCAKGGYFYKPGIELPYKHKDAEVLWLVKYYFNTINPSADLLGADEDQRRIIINHLMCFLPQGCDLDWLSEWIYNRLAFDRIMGVKEDEILGPKIKSHNNDDDWYKWIINSITNAKRPLKSDTGKKIIDNDIVNIFLTVSQSFITVLSGHQGDGKGAISEVLGKGIAWEGEDYSRFYSISLSDKWKDRDYFEKQLFREGGNYYKVFKWLDHETEISDEDIKKLPYIMTFKRTDYDWVEEIFGDFINIAKDWFREENPSIGEYSLRVPDSLRIILEMNDNPEGLLSANEIGTVSFIDCSDPIGIKNKINDLGIFFKDCFNGYKPKKNSDALLEDDEIKEAYNDVISVISKNARKNGVVITVEKIRTEHRVARYCNVAKNKLHEETKSVDDIKEECIPHDLIFDEDMCWNKDEISVGTLTIRPANVALDYAISQNVLPFVTKIRGKVEISNLAEVFECFLKHKLFRCASQLKKSIEEGRVYVSDELNEASNNEYIIKKSKFFYADLTGKYGEAQRKKKDPEKLIGYIVNQVNQLRDADLYTRNVIVNMLLCLSQGFLTVFSGKPGCGKTSICRILGGVLGLWNFDEKGVSCKEYISFEDRRKDVVDLSRYLEISTERGWTSKRDFIGFYNPLTEQFDKANALLYNAFLVMDAQTKEADEAKKAELPCIILLDEANLSSMEYYWADFMNLCEEWKESNSIDLGGGRIFRIPESLHFVATINNDHTTEILSPRLIDRANVIDLPAANGQMVSKADSKSDEVIPITWKMIKDVFVCAEKDAILFEKNDKGEFENDEAAIYKDIKSFVEEHFWISISPRTDIAVSRYWTKAKELFKDEDYYIKNEFAERFNEADLKDISAADRDSFRSILTSCIVSIKPEHGGYEEKNADQNTQAIDYAIAQRILPKITDVSGEEAFNDLLEFMKELYEKALYKSAAIVADIILRGMDLGFYNYFR